MTSLESVDGGLQLELEVRKAEVIRGESIRFLLHLTNTGPDPVTLKDTSEENRAFSIHATSPWGFDAWGDQRSVEVREGEHVDQPRVQPRSELAPGQKWTVEGDVMAWIGELEPGTYELCGHYLDSPPARAQSAGVEIKVSEAAPAYARPVVQNLPLMLSPRTTAWLHKAMAGYDLFVLESSPKNPAVTYADVPVGRLEMPANVFASCYNIAPPVVQHMVWNDGNGSIRTLRFRSDLPPEAPASISLPDENLEPIATPYTDERGNLHVLLATPDGDVAALLQVIGKAAPAFHKIQAEPPLAGLRCALWCRDSVLAFAWADPEETNVYAATIPLNAPPRLITGKSLFQSEHPVIDLLPAQPYNEDGESYERMLYVLTHNQVDDIFYRWKIDLNSGQVEEDGRFEVTGAGTMSVIQSCLTDDLAPLYLFARHDGAVFFADSGFSSFVPVQDESHRPIKTTQHPIMVAPTSFTRMPGTYVRYIDQGRRFVCARIR